VKYVLFNLFGLPVTLYALCVVLALALGLILMYAGQKRNGLREDTTEIFALLALPLGLIGARLFYCLARLALYMEIGLGNVLRLWDGGFALWGAVGGAVLAAVLTARLTRQPVVKLLDALTAPGALTLALCRFAEAASGEGIGLDVWTPFFQRFPFAVYNGDWEMWFWAIFMLEGLVALMIAGVLMNRKLAAPGVRAKVFVILYCSAQILLESLRRDNFLRWLFVRVSQLTAVLVLGGIMVAALINWLKTPKAQRMATVKMVLNWLIFLAGVGICIAMEFAIDKSADLPVWLCYTIMAGCCVVFGIASTQVTLKYKK